MNQASTVSPSTKGVLTLLHEKDPELVSYAIKQLTDLVDTQWFEISSELTILQKICSSSQETAETREFASLIVSKIYYNLGDLQKSLYFALESGEIFNITRDDEFTRTLLSQCIDAYHSLKAKEEEQKKKKQEQEDEDEEGSKPITTETSQGMELESNEFELKIPTVERTFNRIIDNCLSKQQMTTVVGISMPALRIDLIERAIDETEQMEKKKELIAYVLEIALKHVNSKEFRARVIESLIKKIQEYSIPDYFTLVKCFVLLNDHSSVVGVLKYLVANSADNEENYLTALQIAFDLSDYASHFLIQNCLRHFPKDEETLREESESSAKPKLGAGQSSKGKQAESKKDADDELYEDDDGADEKTRLLGSEEKMEVEEEKSIAQLFEEVEQKFKPQFQILYSILSGKQHLKLHLDFLYRLRKTDLGIITKIMNSFQRSSMLHSATVTANAYMCAGTTSNDFLIDNIAWLKKATNWGQFSATASIGVIHRGRVEHSFEVLKQYLPEEKVARPTQPTRGGQPKNDNSQQFSEAGAFFALGLVHADYGGPKVVSYLRKAMKDNANSPVRLHGACLGLGACAMASHDETLVKQLFSIVIGEEAISGEAAAIAIGLILLGCGTAQKQILDELFNYAHETQHDKIVRAISLAIALMMYEREEYANKWIEKLTSHEDPILRYGGMYTIGLAYSGTSNDGAIRKLLQFAASDVSDDVRRAAVINLGFLLFKTPEQCLDLVSLLVESYNPHVRYGVAIAVGIACAGSGSLRAIELLKPVTEDRVDFVRQGAYIALAMILIQFNTHAQKKLDARAAKKKKEMEEKKKQKQLKEEEAAKAAKTGGKKKDEKQEELTKKQEKEAEEAEETEETEDMDADSDLTEAEKISGKVIWARKMFEKSYNGRDEVIAKVGAILASGIIDAGGRNVTIALQKYGNNKMRNIVGLAMFTQHWYWYPYNNFLSLAFEPTCTIGLNKDLKMPKIEIKSNAKPSLFSYIPPIVDEKGQALAQRQEKAELSLQQRQKQLLKRRAGGITLEEREEIKRLNEEEETKKKKEQEEKQKKLKEAENKKEEAPEPEFEMITNPSRVTQTQMQFISFEDVPNQTYQPIKQGSKEYGVIMLKKVRPEVDVEFVEFKDIIKEQEEPGPPLPFKWDVKQKKVIEVIRPQTSAASSSTSK